MPRHYAETPASAKPGPAAARPAAARGAETTRATPGNPLLRGAGDALLQLQRRHGNRYTQQVISHAREPTSQKVAPVSPEAAPVVPASLVLGPASDRAGHRADRNAWR